MQSVWVTNPKVTTGGLQFPMNTNTEVANHDESRVPRTGKRKIVFKWVTTNGPTAGRNPPLVTSGLQIPMNHEYRGNKSR